MKIRRVVLKRGLNDGTVGAEPALDVVSEQVPVEPAAAGQGQAGLEALAQRRVEVAVTCRVSVVVVLNDGPAHTRWRGSCK